MESETVKNVINPKEEAHITLTHETITENQDLISLLSADPATAHADFAEETLVEDEEETATNERCPTADSLESIKSGESVFKLFTFDSKKCTANVEKCVAFWRKIDEIGLQPIDCSLYKPKRQESGSVTEEQFSEDETSEDFSKKEERKRLEDIQISWCDALKELQKRKLDRVAKCARPMRCGMCEALHFEVEDEKDLQNTHAEIVALNNWKPGRIRKIRKGDGVKKPGTISKDETVTTKSIVETTERKREELKMPEKSAITKGVVHSTEQGKYNEAEIGPKRTTDVEEPEEKQEDVSIGDGNAEKESCLSLMETLLSELLAKTSEEIDVKQLVNEIITTATEKIKSKSHEQLENPVEIKEESFQMPPYSFKGEYPCLCEHPSCDCEAEKPVAEVKTKKIAAVEKRRQNKEPTKIDMSTQCPNEVEKEESVIKGGYCIICGLEDCICKYIQENSGVDVVVHTCESFDTENN